MQQLKQQLNLDLDHYYFHQAQVDCRPRKRQLIVGSSHVTAAPEWENAHRAQLQRKQLRPKAATHLYQQP
ncbi:conserved hypothetical protein [Histoplasma capsulatum var. duboisii H88]|uniref:Uncharacterized protein n=1 Tax=Ajellomyces capsulatus (strain H88) TaxID=544711 RepID=F0UGS5_AJEC8|nr:conserved hypothetical protein [Histoplasma capsulatum var. duboisii H88]